MTFNQLTLESKWFVAHARIKMDVCPKFEENPTMPCEGIILTWMASQNEKWQRGIKLITDDIQLSHWMYYYCTFTDWSDDTRRAFQGLDVLLVCCGGCLSCLLDTTLFCYADKWNIWLFFTKKESIAFWAVILILAKPTTPIRNTV